MKAGPERANPGHLVHVDRIADAFDARRPERFHFEVSSGELLGVFGDDDRASRRERLHPRRQARRVADRRVLGVRVVGANRAYDHLAGVESDANFHRRISGRAQLCRVAAHFLLHAERRVKSALRMVLVRNRGSEQREDSVAGGLHDVTVVAMHRVDHQLQRGIDECARFFGIEILHQIHRSFDIGK